MKTNTYECEKDIVKVKGDSEPIKTEYYRKSSHTYDKPPVKYDKHLDTI